MDFLLISSNLVDSGTFYQALAADGPTLAAAAEATVLAAASVLTRVLI